MVNKGSSEEKVKHIRVAELFAGVGGFRLGLESVSPINGKVFKTAWVNQWEPATKVQHAAQTYRHNLREEDEVLEKLLSNEDIFAVTGRTTDDNERVNTIPKHDLIVGGFPCQDYSVARPLSHSAGLEGKKGVLWWSIYNIIHNAHKKSDSKKLPYLFLENVDRLLKSPSKNRGRDFAIILSSLNSLGYIAEWRVINAAEYGFPQKRRRTFIVAYPKTSSFGKELLKAKKKESEAHLKEWVHTHSVIAKAFPSAPGTRGGCFTIAADPAEISQGFTITDHCPDVVVSSPFENAGVMIDCRIYSAQVTPIHNGDKITLGQIVSETDEDQVDEKYYIHPDKLPAWQQQKSAHEFMRTSKTGHEYLYKEGALPFPDHWHGPSRTIITSEGGVSASRMKHVVDITNKQGYSSGRTIGDVTYTYRRLVPEELEALCMFPRGHTKHMIDEKKGKVETTDTKRAFFMGNALVVGVVKQIGEELLRRI